MKTYEIEKKMISLAMVNNIKGLVSVVFKKDTLILTIRG